MSVTQFPNALEILTPYRNNTNCRLFFNAAGYKEIFSPLENVRNVPGGNSSTSFHVNGEELKNEVSNEPSQNNILPDGDLMGEGSGPHLQHIIGAGIFRNDDFDQGGHITIQYGRDPGDFFSTISLEQVEFNLFNSAAVHGADLRQTLSIFSNKFAWMISKVVLLDYGGGVIASKTIPVTQTSIYESIGDFTFNFNHTGVKIIQIYMRNRLDHAIAQIANFLNRNPTGQVSREICGFDLTNAFSYVHLDIGGEGTHNAGGTGRAGFDNAINVNTLSNQSGVSPPIPIPNLVKIQSWDNPIPFADDFADYITMQNTPVTNQSIADIERCIRPGGAIGFWVDEQYNNLIAKLAARVGGTVLKGANAHDEFGSYDGHSYAGHSKLLIRVPMS